MTPNSVINLSSHRIAVPMLTGMDEQVRALTEELRSNFAEWSRPDGWPNDADCALIDSVFSTRANYKTTVLPLVKRWRDWPSRPAGGRLSSILKVPVDDFRSVIDNDQFVPGRSKNRLRKYEAVYEVADRLVSRHLDEPDQIRACAIDDGKLLEDLVRRTKGVGRAQYSYFLMLLGVQGIKADTLVTAWVERAIGIKGLTQLEVERLVTESADQLDVSPIVVDHTIWSSESKTRWAQRFLRS